MKTDYHEKKAARIESYKNLAEKNNKLFSEKVTQAIDTVSCIPMGQPILVGHHSEASHRARLKRSDNQMRAAGVAQDKAKYYADKAESAEKNTAISSDDPEAIKKLKEKLQKCQDTQERMKAVNKIAKSKKLSVSEKIEKIIDDGLLNIEQANEIMTPDCHGAVGFASFTLANNNANIRNIKKRIKELEKVEKMVSKETELNGCTIIESVEKNRVQIVFPEKPSAETRKELKSKGFKWSPSQGVWQNYLHSWNIERAFSVVNDYKSN